MDAPGNGVLIFLAALMPVLALGALLTDLLLAAAPRRGKRPDVACPAAPEDSLVKPAGGGEPAGFTAGWARAAFGIAHAMLGAGALACALSGRPAALWAAWLALPAWALLLALTRSRGRGAAFFQRRHAGQMKK